MVGKISKLVSLAALAILVSIAQDRATEPVPAAIEINPTNTTVIPIRPVLPSHIIRPLHPDGIVADAIERGYSPCVEEDGPSPCYWDASKRGNGIGNDFVLHGANR